MDINYIVQCRFIYIKFYAKSKRNQQTVMVACNIQLRYSHQFLIPLNFISNNNNNNLSQVLLEIFLMSLKHY